MLRLQPVMRIGVLLFLLPLAGAAEVIKFQSDDWITESDTAHETPEDDCSIIGVFRNTTPEGVKGSFSLLADLKNNQVAVVGEPPPIRASLRIDRSPALVCAGTPHCIFSSSDAESIARQLQAGSLLLIDVFTAKGLIRFSLNTKGYRAGLAKIYAYGYRSTR